MTKATLRLMIPLLCCATSACSEEVLVAREDTGDAAMVVDASIDAADLGDAATDGAGMADGADVDASTCGTPDSVIYHRIDLLLLEGCTTFRGSLVLTDNDGAHFLRPLSSLEVIEGDLVLNRNRELESLEGLENLREVGGVLHFGYNEKLESLAQLSNLRRVGGQVRIRTTFLHDLTGLEGLDTLEKLVISLNISLTSFKGLDGLKSIRGDLYIQRNYVLPREEVEAFVDRVDVGGVVQIDYWE